MMRHLLPNVVAPIMVLASLSAAGIILVEAGLSFIGAGVQPPTPAWGGMVSSAYETLVTRNGWPIIGPATGTHLDGDGVQLRGGRGAGRPRPAAAEHPLAAGAARAAPAQR